MTSVAAPLPRLKAGFERPCAKLTSLGVFFATHVWT